MHSEKTTIRLAAVDMDGTLLHDDKSISDYTLFNTASFIPPMGLPEAGTRITPFFTILLKTSNV